VSLSPQVWHFLISVSSIEDDLGLSDVQYQTCVSILFVGYVITGIPSNMLITRVKVPTFLVAVMMTWAVISIATGLTKNYMGLLLTRFFLGVVEAPYYPGEVFNVRSEALLNILGAIYIISNFYTRTEVATRIAILYTGKLLCSLLGSTDD